MALYFYKGKSFKGEEVCGVVNTENKYSVVRRIKSQGLVPIRIKEINTKSLSYMVTVYIKSVSQKELAIFCKQFGVMLESGVNVLESLNFIAKQTQNKNFNHILADICWHIKSGFSLADALKNYPHVFSEVFIAMIEAGEASGNLSDILKMLSDYYSDISMRKEKIKNAMTYPTLLGILSFIVVNFLAINVLPVYASMFVSYGAELPKLTQIVMWVTSHIAEIIFVSFIMLLIFCSFYLQCTKSENLAYNLDKLILSVPLVGQLIKKNESCKIVRILYFLVKSGIPILKSLEIVTNTVKNRFIKREIEKIRLGLRQGDNLSELFSYKVFSPIMAKMIAIGEESGTLEEMLEKIAIIYENEVDILLERMMSLVGPVFLIILTVIISVIIISTFLPMFEIYNLL